MPKNFPFGRSRRKTLRNHTTVNHKELQTELATAITKLSQFSAVLRQELEVANREEDRLNPPEKGAADA